MAGRHDGAGAAAKKPRQPKRKEVSPKQLEIERRMLAVEDLYLRQHSQREIAALLKTSGFKHISQKTVSRDIERMRAEWKEKRIVDLDNAKEKELSKIDAVERAAWESYEVSRGPKGANAGDGGFLRVILDCVEERAKILGLYAPKIREWRMDDAMKRLAAVLSTNPEELPA